MDDDESFCDVMSNILKELGYFATCVFDGREAIEEYKNAKENEEQYDIVIMDLSVKEGMNGEDASKEILDYDTNAIIVISSGYSSRPIISKYKDHGLKGVLLKPYNLTQLKAIIEEFV